LAEAAEAADELENAKKTKKNKEQPETTVVDPFSAVVAKKACCWPR